MQVVGDKMETVHLYVVREQPKQPYMLLPLLCALVCLSAIAAVTLYSAQHPSYEHQRLTVPAVALPLKTITASVPIIPTGVKTYPATYAHGYLTFSNGSVIGQSVPVGFIIDGAVTDSAVYVPPATANGFGMSTVPAHLLTSGINKSTLSINEVIGASLFVRNLSPFTGGRRAHTVKYATASDKQTALLQARGILFGRSSGLHYPCQELRFADLRTIKMTWRCQFVAYHVPSYMHVSSVKLAGTFFLVDVSFLARPVPVRMR